MINLPPKTKKWLRLTGKIFLSFVVIGLLTWFFVISPYLTRQEKQRFESAATELEKISQDIQALIGNPSKAEERKSCDRPNLKFEKGPLSCNLSLELSYPVKDSTKANIVVSTVKGLSSHEIRRGPFAKDIVFIPADVESKQILYQDIEKIAGLSCSISYKLEKDTDLSNILLLTLSCGSPARAEHYPVED